MTESSTWNDVRKIIDELEVKMHLATMDVRDRWHALQPRLEQVHQAVTVQSKRIGQALASEIDSIEKALRAMRDDLRSNEPPIPEHIPTDDQC
jgi:ribosomal protein L19E